MGEELHLTQITTPTTHYTEYFWLKLYFYRFTAYVELVEIFFFLSSSPPTPSPLLPPSSAVHYNTVDSLSSLHVMGVRHHKHTQVLSDEDLI